MMLALVLATGAAQKDGEKEGRLIITPAGDDDNMINVTIGLNSAILTSLALFGVVIAVIFMSRLNDQGKAQPASYAAPA